MRKIIALATVAVASAALAVPAFGATKTVNVGDIWFISKAKNKGTVTVKKGTKVTWKWVGKFPHTVTVKSGPVKFTSKKLTKGTYSRTLTKPGTYKLYCKVHTAAAQAMTLKVTA